MVMQAIRIVAMNCRSNLAHIVSTLLPTLYHSHIPYSHAMVGFFPFAGYIRFPVYSNVPCDNTEGTQQQYICMYHRPKI